MDADGCVRVHWAPGYTENTKMRQMGGIYGPIAHDLGAMAGEISPDMMFCGYYPK